MNIIYFINKETHETKMSRVRFHSIDAISKLSNLKYDGPGWPGFKSLQESIKQFKADLVIWYKPLELPGFKEVSVPKIIQYNEMYDKNWTTREITESKSNLVICHHLNDWQNYSNLKNVKLVNIPHSAERTIFKDYGMYKKFHISLLGSLGTAYPLRRRFKQLIEEKLSKKFNCYIHRHPGYRLTNAQSNEELIKYAKIINQSKICLTCSSRYHYRLGKYVEIPMSNSLLVGDLPDEQNELFRKIMVVIDPNESDESIINKIEYYLINEKERKEKTKMGMNLMLQNYTQEHYAERFIKLVKENLNV